MLAGTLDSTGKARPPFLFDNKQNAQIQRFDFPPKKASELKFKRLTLAYSEKLASDFG
jgi:hypothetical protein